MKDLCVKCVNFIENSQFAKGLLYGLCGGGIGLFILFVISGNPKIYGNIADWIGAVGTIGAIILALYTRKQMGIINAKVYCSIKLSATGEEDPNGKPGKTLHMVEKTQFKVILSNLGNANLLVTGLEVEIEPDCHYNLVISKPELIETGNVKILFYNGIDIFSSDVDKPDDFGGLFPKAVYEYIKSNKIKLILTTHDGSKTKWPIEIQPRTSA
ncbi:hypothetical protein KIJ05_07750 [Leuconostoc gelidum subsp. gasicomitatum]|uniref:hypothetical protein n=1 Tax=Leuconostoc gasicomitatum TaxID=115778 RepID=UPI001CC57E13|nr:hypothetical protein [Leuconostoc gasicomitatum]MBZ5985010.1 hypothetical protein [Leuconostoc gasicomitatum]